MSSIRGPRWYRYFNEKCLLDSHLPFVNVTISSISPLWRNGETHHSTKTSKILFWIVMPTFRKSCWWPWLHSLKNPKRSCIPKQIFSRGQFWPSGIVIVCVCVCVCVSVLCVNQLLVSTITQDPFKLGSPNLDQRCKTTWLRSLLFCGAIDLDLQGQI